MLMYVSAAMKSYCPKSSDLAREIEELRRYGNPYGLLPALFSPGPYSLVKVLFQPD